MEFQSVAQYIDWCLEDGLSALIHANAPIFRHSHFDREDSFHGHTENVKIYRFRMCNFHRNGDPVLTCPTLLFPKALTVRLSVSIKVKSAPQSMQMTFSLSSNSVGFVMSQRVFSRPSCFSKFLPQVYNCDVFVSKTLWYNPLETYKLEIDFCVWKFMAGS